MKVEVSTSGEKWTSVPFVDDGDLITVRLSEVYAATGQFGTFQVRTGGPRGDPFYVTLDPTIVDADVTWKPKSPR